MHIVFDESNSFDPRKDICSVDDDIGELVETILKKKMLASFWNLKVQAKRIVRKYFNLP